MVKSYKGLRYQFEELPESVKSYLSKLGPYLDSSSDYDVALAYLFMKIEEGHHRALYAGLVKQRRCDKAYAKEVVSKQHMTRDLLKVLFKHIFGKPISKELEGYHDDAARVRDHLIHGKTPNQTEMRGAVSAGLKYVDGMNELVKAVASFEPYGKMQGVLSKCQVVDRATSVWIAKGIGFSL